MTVVQLAEGFYNKFWFKGVKFFKGNNFKSGLDHQY
jgi:hypothetical protein